MKKIFLAILFIFVLCSCNNVDIRHQVDLSKQEKTVLLDNFPIDYEKLIKEKLERDGWKISVVDNGKSVILIQCSKISKRSLFGFGVDGSVRYVDLRTGKKIAQYDFTSTNPHDVINKVVETMKKISNS